MYQQIFVGVDGSPCSDMAEEAALAFAAATAGAGAPAAMSMPPGCIGSVLRIWNPAFLNDTRRRNSSIHCERRTTT